MTRRPPTALLFLALVCLALVLPALARAEDPNDPNTPLPMGPTPPCFDVKDVVPGIAFGFQDPNDPNSINWYSDLKNCASQCKKTGTVCEKYVKRVVSCQNKAASDRKTFNVKIHCDKLKGDALDACEQPFVDELNSTKAQVTADQTQAVSDCEAGANRCAEKCNVAP
ncbi:MAG TPA: hypothetical protein VMR50_04535 [Myxococcota bacterium]|nr:hypothetical protein [Myxococcota bacterium]